MNCTNCGANLSENDMFCPKCGTPVQKSENTNYNYERPVNQQVNGQVNGQNYGQTNMYSNQYGGSKSDGKVVKVCIIIVIIVAILAAVGFVVYSIVGAFNKNKNTTTITSEVTPSTQKQNENTTPVSTVSNTQNSSTYKVNYGGFKLYIPDDMLYEFDVANNAINIGDALSSWVAQLSIQKLPFQQLKQKKSYLSSYFTEVLSAYNAKVSNATVETVDGVEFIIMEMDLAGNHEIMAISELNSMYAACLEILNENNDYDRDVLKNLTPILKTAEYEGESKNLETNGKIKNSELNQALEKALEEQADE